VLVVWCVIVLTGPIVFVSTCSTLLELPDVRSYEAVTVFATRVLVLLLVSCSTSVTVRVWFRSTSNRLVLDELVLVSFKLPVTSFPLDTLPEVLVPTWVRLAVNVWFVCACVNVKLELLPDVALNTPVTAVPLRVLELALVSTRTLSSVRVWFVCCSVVLTLDVPVSCVAAYVVTSFPVVTTLEVPVVTVVIDANAVPWLSSVSTRLVLELDVSLWL
jgi:hypothetical protein